MQTLCSEFSVANTLIVLSGGCESLCFLSVFVCFIFKENSSETPSPSRSVFPLTIRQQQTAEFSVKFSKADLQLYYAEASGNCQRKSACGLDDNINQ